MFPEFIFSRTHDPLVIVNAATQLQMYVIYCTVSIREPNRWTEVEGAAKWEGVLVEVSRGGARPRDRQKRLVKRSIDQDQSDRQDS